MTEFNFASPFPVLQSVFQKDRNLHANIHTVITFKLKNEWSNPTRSLDVINALGKQCPAAGVQPTLLSAACTTCMCFSTAEATQIYLYTYKTIFNKICTEARNQIILPAAEQH